METVKKTTAGVVFWTPAPTRASPASSVESEDLWDDEERAETDDDFSQQVDESGIIGLEEALGRVGLEGAHGPLTPQGAEPEWWETEPQTESPGEDERNTSKLEEINGGFRVSRQRKKYLDTTEQEEDGDGEQKTEGNGLKKESCADFRTTDTPESFKPRGAFSESVRPPSVQTLLGRHWPESPLAPPPIAPHLFHFTTEELAAAPDIEAETLPDAGLSESFPESSSVCTSRKSSPRCPRDPESRTSAQTAANHPGAKSKIPVNVSAKRDPSASRKRQPVPSDTHLRGPGLSKTGTGSLRTRCQNQNPQHEQRTTGAKTRAQSRAAEVAQTREGSRSFHTPDFSKVEPRVRFPKAGYKPPKSQRPVKRKSFSPEPPFMFKSPADIVKEVLLSPSDGPPDPPDSDGPPTACEPTSVVPQEFRCREHAMTLLDELQEDNYRLKLKCAEAANTIDQLRLEAKVNLYSDPPRPGLSVHSGLNLQPLKLMTLEFPQAQRPDVASASAPSDPHGSPAARGSPAASVSSSTPAPKPSMGRQITEILSRQADSFLQQLQGFDELLKSGELQPVQQTKGLSELLQVLDSLERSYLLARDQHKVLQQRGAESSRFDPERDLEALIFQFGLQMDELKEQVERSQTTQEAPPTPPPQTTPSPGVLEGEELQNPPSLFTAGPGPGAEVDSTSAGDEDDQETLKSVFFEPQNKPRHVEPDRTTLLKLCQSFEKLPRGSGPFLVEDAHSSAGPRPRIQTRTEDGGGPTEKTGNAEPQRGSSNSKPDPSPVLGSRSSPPPPGPSRHQSSLPSVPVALGRSHSSSTSSLGEVAASERRDNKSKTMSARRTVMCQDGVISPETDSGFIGSESSRLTPAAASPLHQRAPQGVSVKPRTVPDSAPRPAPSPPIRRRGGDAALRPQPVRRGRAERASHISSSSSSSSSAQHRPRTDSETVSESGLDLDRPPSVSENDSHHFAESIGSAHSSHLSPSAAAPRRHGDRLRAVSFSQLAKHSEAQRLQAEVNRLRDWFQAYGKNTVGGATAADQNASAPHPRPEKHRSEIRKRSRDRRTDDVDNSAVRRTVQARSGSAHRRPSHSISEPQTSTHRVSRSTQTAVEPDGRRSRTPVCPQCLTRQGQTKQPVGAAVRNHSPRHCLICGRSEPFSSPGPDCGRNCNNRTNANTDWTQNTPVYPPLLFYYPPPFFVSPNKSMNVHSEVRGHGEGRRRRSSSCERRDSVDRSLNRAIRAARTMKHTSRHMACSLASGLQYHEVLHQTTWTSASRGQSSHPFNSETY